MDSRLKERLIGAAVLVALGVWLIPWVLDGPEPANRVDTAALTLPAPEDSSPVRSQTIRLDQRHATVEKAPAPPTSEQREPAHEVESAPVHAAEPSAPVVEETRHPDAEAVAVPSSAWVVQLGSFGEAENAERLASRVDAYGYDARVSDFRAGGRVMHRVRVGPHATRGEAESVASSLSAHGFVAQVVGAE